MKKSAFILILLLSFSVSACNKAPGVSVEKDHSESNAQLNINVGAEDSESVPEMSQSSILSISVGK